ncbi:helix-turn-helix domain-containing protein [Jiulongibacter sp. NS-SX5]|uniref:helix-turn-helix domain-containing protein n=1 Tax=Jiulongibacter sp. NS-SX5 TaxID=3463854 RepID=UPI004059B5BA
MKQPELGNKISELRQSKGLTQTELAESCNLSLRTIQRIEAAEVTPRAYTIKQIFEALGHDRVFEKPFSQTENPAKQVNWFSDKRSSILNTEKMRIIVAMSILFGAIGLTFLGISDYLKTKNYQKNETGLEDLNFDFISRFNAGDIEEIGEVYLSTATLRPVNQATVIGREDIIKYYQDVYDSGFRLVSDKIEFMEISDSVAIESGSWVGYNGQNFEGSYMAHWKKVNGQWYIENYITNYSEEY